MITLTEGILISISSLMIVLATLYFLSVILDLFRHMEPKESAPIVQPKNREDDEEERLVASLVATILAGKNKPNAHFHISKITRVK